MTPGLNNSLLTLTDVHAGYQKKEILRGVSLSIARGEIIAILGGNGSGKSTLLKTIAGLLVPARGMIVFNCKDISHTPIHVRQQMGIGFLLQGGRVFPNLSVAENFQMAVCHARSQGLPGFRLGNLFPQLRERSGDRAGLLSGGQRQMLAIEIVLAQEPSLALLDEPTAALSGDIARSMLGTIAEHARQSQSAILVVEQNVAEAIAVSTRCLRLTDGKIHELTDQHER